MKKLTSPVATAALAAAAVAITAGTATAAPAAPQPGPIADNSALALDLMPGVHYSSNVSDHSVRLATPLGTVTEQGSQMLVQDPAGRVVYGKPFVVAPKAGQVVGPASAPAALAGKPAPKPVAAPLRDIDWQSDFNSDLSVAGANFGLATGLGAMIGGVAGVVAGCPLGAATGGLLFVPVAAVGGLAVLAGCLAGAGLLGSIGPVVGGAVLGVPVGIACAVQMYNTMHAAHEIAGALPR